MNHTEGTKYSESTDQALQLSKRTQKTALTPRDNYLLSKPWIQCQGLPAVCLVFPKRERKKAACREQNALMQCCCVLTEEEQRWSCEYKLCTKTGNLIFLLSTWSQCGGRESVREISAAVNIKSCRTHGNTALHMSVHVFMCDFLYSTSAAQIIPGGWIKSRKCDRGDSLLWVNHLQTSD